MNKVCNSVNSTIRKTERIIDFVWQFPKNRQARFLYITGIFILYFGGCFAIYYFMNGGSIQLNLHDWAEVTAPRYAFLKDAVTKGKLPLHMPGEWALRNVTDRFLSVADTNISPQVLLLKYMDIGDFFLINTLILYSLGFIGLLILARYLRLSLLTFGLMFGLVFFNGHILSHIAVGHANWSAYYLIPFFAYLVLRLLDGLTNTLWISWMSLYMLILLLQGAFHLFVASWLFLGILWLISPSERRPIFMAGLATAGLGALRLLPPVLELGNFDTEFLSGYPTVIDLISSLVELRLTIPDEIFISTPMTNLNWWEFNFYIGLAGAIFVVLLSTAYLVYKNDCNLRYRLLGLPILGLLALSIGPIYRFFHLLRVPLLSSQRVSSRLAFIPVALLIFLAVHQAQIWLEEKEKPKALAMTFGLTGVVIASDLWQHLKLWRVVNMGRLFPPKDLDLALNIVSNHPDQPYFVILIVGALISSLTAIFLAYKLRKENFSRNSVRPNKQPS